jgi:hypothetical protein
MTVTKPQVNRYITKLYRFLEQGHRITFRKMRKDRGSILVEIYPTEIHLDPRDEVISTLVHETLHYFYPEASEEWILSMEDGIVKKLTHRQVRNIIRCMGNNI